MEKLQKGPAMWEQVGGWPVASASAPGRPSCTRARHGRSVAPSAAGSSLRQHAARRASCQRTANFFAKRNWPDLIFYPVVINWHGTIVRVVRQWAPASQAVIDRFGRRTAVRYALPLCQQPGMQGIGLPSCCLVAFLASISNSCTWRSTSYSTLNGYVALSEATSAVR